MENTRSDNCTRVCQCRTCAKCNNGCSPCARNNPLGPCTAGVIGCQKFQPDRPYKPDDVDDLEKRILARMNDETMERNGWCDHLERILGEEGLTTDCRKWNSWATEISGSQIIDELASRFE